MNERINAYLLSLDGSGSLGGILRDIDKVGLAIFW